MNCFTVLVYYHLDRMGPINKWILVSFLLLQTIKDISLIISLKILYESIVQQTAAYLQSH